MGCGCSGYANRYSGISEIINLYNIRIGEGMKIKKTINVDVEIRVLPILVVLATVVIVMFCMYMGVSGAADLSEEIAQASIKEASDIVKGVDKKMPHQKRITPFSWEVELRGNIQQIVIKRDGIVRDTRQAVSKDHSLIGTGVFDDVLVIMSE